MNFGNHAREFRGGAETMTSNDATWDTIEAPKKPRVQRHLGVAHCGLTSMNVRGVDNRISRNCVTDESNAIDVR